MDLIAEGLKKKLIRFEDDGKYIVYLHQGKRRNYENPEEKVQAETFIKLVLEYNYPVKRIQQFVSVQMGSETKEADIIVYDDDALKAPLIVVECKKPDVSELEFARASAQASSYAVPEGAKFVWVTSRIKNEYFQIPDKKPKDRIPTATGAGVKSSVLFLKKHTEQQTKRIQDTKEKLKAAIRQEQKFEEKLDALETEKKEIQKNLTGLDRPPGLTGKELKESDAYKKWWKGVSESFADQVEDIRYRLTEIYETKRRKALDDYNIFMAIAEDIGYDATGRATKANELDPIAGELRRFITAIEEGKE